MLRLPSIDDLQPREPAEAAAMLAEAARLSTPIVPVGSGSQIDHPPAQARLMWTRHLDRILDHQPDDLTITVQSGATLEVVQRQLATANQHLPHRPSFAGTATIGGLLASHRPGLTRLGHGPLRDRVLGMTVALSSGELASSGGRVVKNVAGYDLHRLHVGAHGTLGVITQVTLKVSPLPAGRTLLVAPLVPTTVLASANLDERLGAPQLRVAFEDVEAGRERAVRETAALAARHGLPAFEREDGIALPPELADLGQEDAIHVMSFVPRGETRVLLAPLGQPWPAVVDLGEGMLRWAVPEGAWPAVRHLTAAVRAAGGWSEITRAPAAVWPAVREARPAVASEPRMLALRGALDPAGIMNPGRLLQGLL
jgi:glycolate oxidase FAD binding subunit